MRGYRFDRTHLIPRGATAAPIVVADGQLRYELAHLLAKLETRDPNRFEDMRTLTLPDPHPAFTVTPGRIASWERPQAKS